MLVYLVLTFTITVTGNAFSTGVYVVIICSITEIQLNGTIVNIKEYLFSQTYLNFNKLKSELSIILIEL